MGKFFWKYFGTVGREVGFIKTLGKEIR